MLASQSSRLQSDINVTPLVDVCLVLLIIFMVVMPAMVSGTAVTLPETKHGGALDESRRPIAITVQDDGTVSIDALVVRGDQVKSELASLHTREPNRRVAVRGDKRVAYGAVSSVLDAARGAGYEDVSLVTLKADS